MAERRATRRRRRTKAPAASSPAPSHPALPPPLLAVRQPQPPAESSSDRTNVAVAHRPSVSQMNPSTQSSIETQVVMHVPPAWHRYGRPSTLARNDPGLLARMDPA